MQRQEALARNQNITAGIATLAHSISEIFGRAQASFFVGKTESQDRVRLTVVKTGHSNELFRIEVVFDSAQSPIITEAVMDRLGYALCSALLDDVKIAEPLNNMKVSFSMVDTSVGEGSMVKLIIEGCVEPITN